MPYMQAQADAVADELGLLLIDLRTICADGQITAAEFPRLAAICDALPALVNRVDWIGASIALAVQVLRRGPDVPTPEERLARRLADLGAIAQDEAPTRCERVGASTT